MAEEIEIVDINDLAELLSTTGAEYLAVRTGDATKKLKISNLPIPSLTGYYTKTESDTKFNISVDNTAGVYNYNQWVKQNGVDTVNVPSIKSISFTSGSSQTISTAWLESQDLQKCNIIAIQNRKISGNYTITADEVGVYFDYTGSPNIILQPGQTVLLIRDSVSGTAGSMTVIYRQFGPFATSSISAVWGAITGTITDQTDLTSYIATQIANLVDSSPAALDTLNELAAALGDDPNFATTVTNALATKWTKGGNALTSETVFGGTSGAFGIDVRTNNLTALKILSSPASATNYLTIQSATTANPAILSVDGSTNVGIIIQAKGAESIYLKNSAAGNTLKLKWFDSFAGIYRDVISEAGGSNSVGIGTGFTSVNTASNFNLGNNAVFRSANNVLKIVGSSSTTSSVGVVFGTNSANFGSFAPTTGTHYLINMWSETNNSFNPASGTANMRMIDLSAFSINQTGTASGNISMININPTITSVSGSLYAIRSNIASGSNIYNLYIDGTANNYLNGNTSIRTSAATAFLTIGACTPSASSLRIIAGTAPAGPSILDGNIYYTSSNLMLTVGTTNYTLLKAITWTTILDFPNISANSYQDLTVIVTGAVVGDPVTVGEDTSTVGTNIFYKGWVSATDTVTIRAFNVDPVNSYDPGSATFKISVQKF